VKAEEREERLIHRLESFSDLVMGFSLAFLALTLAIPRHFVDLVHDDWWLIAYYWSFGMVSVIWWHHRRLFTHYFSPSTLTVVLNFLLLSMLGLMMYFVQVFVHLRAEEDKALALLAYFGTQGVEFTSMGLLYLLGTRARWAKLDPEERYEGMRFGVRFTIPGTIVLCGIVFMVLHGVHHVNEVLLVPLCAAIGVAITRAVLSVARARIDFGFDKASPRA
jgi:uncharacterized membrane protein